MSSTRDVYFSFFMFTTNLRPEDPEYAKGVIRHIWELRGLGYKGFDLPIFPNETWDHCREVESYVELKRALDRAGLEGVGFTTNVAATRTFDPTSVYRDQREAALAYLKSWVDITAALGATITAGPIVFPYNVFPTTDTNAPIWSDTLQAWVQPRYCHAQPVMNELGEHAEGKNVRLAIEPVDHWETPAPNMIGGVLSFLRGVPSRRVGVCVDSAHVVLGSSGPEIFKQQILRIAEEDRLNYVQISAPDRGAIRDSWIPWVVFLGATLPKYEGPLLIEILRAGGRRPTQDSRFGMLFPQHATRRTDHQTASEVVYDAVIVGSGISGAIIASELSAAGMRTLILEAGQGRDGTLAGYEEYLHRFYATAWKDNQAPYPPNPDAPMPRGTDARRIRPGQPDASGYLVQDGPFSTDAVYTRVLGGTTMHWEGKTLRMLPEDFEMRTRFGQGEDWPLDYWQLVPYYEKAEREIGVSADVEDQSYLGITFTSGYVFPMRGLPLSYLDRMVARDLDGTKVKLDGEEYELAVRPFPQGRNGIPNPAYDGGRGFVPATAVSTYQVEEGGRCQGNNNCVPICPVQAKYNAGKTLAKALQTGRVDLLPQTVASKVHIDPNTGRVSGIEYRAYRDPTSPHHTTGTVRGRVFVLCGNAIENPRLMLASGLASTSGLVGRNLMDHAYLLNWALMPEVAGTMRGTNCTGGIVALRGGAFRRRQAAFSVDIHNDGWGWAMGSPYTDLIDLVDTRNKFGPALRRDLVDRITRQLQLAFMIEVLPSQSNRVTVDPGYTDQLGNMRPVLTYTIPDYTMRGASYARRLARRIFQRLGAADYTMYDPADYGYLSHEGEGYVIRGGNHLAGTHIMGTSPANSVVDSEQRSWDYENLYLVGGGSMPSIGASNITLTVAALGFRSAEHILVHLRKETAPYEVAAR